MSVRDNMKKGTAEMVILCLLQSREMYGYEISQELTNRSDGKFTLQEGSMYPTLYRLVNNKYVVDRVVISEENQRLRKYYSVTDEGLKYYKQLVDEYAVVSEGIDKILKSK